MQSANVENKLDYERPIMSISLLEKTDVISTSSGNGDNLEPDGWT